MAKCRTTRQGFTLVETIVVVAILVVLALLLFPVLYRVRTRAHLVTCPSNQRQVAASMIAFAQENGDVWPEEATAWTDIRVATGVLKCPSSSRANGYVYNSTIAGLALGKTRDRLGVPVDPLTRFLTADGAHENSIDGRMANVAYEKGDLDFARHSGVLPASFLDGHTEILKDVSGWLPDRYDLLSAPPELLPGRPVTLTASTPSTWRIVAADGSPVFGQFMMVPETAGGTPVRSITVNFQQVGQYQVVATGRNGTVERRQIGVTFSLLLQDETGATLERVTVGPETSAVTLRVGGVPTGMALPLEWTLAPSDVGTLTPGSGNSAVFRPSSARRSWTAAHTASITASVAGVALSLPVSVSPAPLGQPGLQGYYFDGGCEVVGPAAALRVDPQLNFPDWAGGPGVPGLRAGQFAARWYGRVLTNEHGNYILQVTADDGVRIWWDGAKVLDRWGDWGQTSSVQVPGGTDTTHDVVIDYQQKAGIASLLLRWARPSAPTVFAPVPASALYHAASTDAGGLQGEYWNTTAGPGAAGTGVATRVEPWLDCQWDGSPAPGVSQDFSARWIGKVRAPVTGQYAIQVFADDGVRVYWGADTEPRINAWNHLAREQTFVTYLTAGTEYPVRIDLRDTGADAAVALRWGLPGLDATHMHAIPPQYLSH